MQIDPAKQQATVKSQEDTHAAAEANLKYAEQQYARAKDLSSAGVISKQEFDQAKSAVDNAHAQVRALECPGAGATSRAALLPGCGSIERNCRAIFRSMSATGSRSAPYYDGR